MATYAIGDVQGCYEQLRTLLAQLRFEPRRDRLWFCGDLVNRGPASAEVLRFARGLDDRVVAVLGNHDLHLLAAAYGKRPLRTKDTFTDVLDAPDGQALIDWLRNRPLLHHDAELGYTLVHAGVPPQWDLDAARRCADEVEQTLRGDHWTELLERMYGDQPERWSESLTGWDRLRVIINCFTRIRYCNRSGRLTMHEKGPPGTQPSDMMPWYAVPERKTRGEAIIFGHWATLQIRDRLAPGYGVHHLDTGCAWGGYLTAMRLEDGQRFCVPCSDSVTRHRAAPAR